MRRHGPGVSYFVALVLGIVLYLVSGPQKEHFLTDLLFSLGSGALIVGLIRLLGNMKMFASRNWGTRLLKRIFLRRSRSGREETEDYSAYRGSLGGQADAVPLLIASAVLMVLSRVTARLP